MNYLYVLDPELADDFEQAVKCLSIQLGVLIAAVVFGGLLDNVRAFARR